jgi:hypothetical protein
LESGGRYKADTPFAAAKKAARRLFRSDKAGERTGIRFALRESTKGSDKGVFYYTAKKVALDTPITVSRGNVEIVIKSKYDVKACPAF